MNGETVRSASLQELKDGTVLSKDGGHICLVCGKVFEAGEVYAFGEKLLLTEKAARRHVQEAHGGMFEMLLALDKRLNSLTEAQKSLLREFYAGTSDRETAQKTGLAEATVRTLRFNFREKARQAKIYLAIAELMEEGLSEAGGREKMLDIHKGATMVDERYNITEKEYEEWIAKYFNIQEGLKLKSFPKKEKRKLAVLKRIFEEFNPVQTYSEKEVNGVIKAIYEDYVTIRRYLIEYGFLDRKADGSAYWVKA